MQAEKIFHLRQKNQHRNAIGKANDDRHRNKANQHTQTQHAHEQQPYARQQRGQHQTRHAMLADDAVNDNNEGASRPTNLHLAAAQC